MEENSLTVGLWVHETLRVFYDRLINDEDRTWLTGMLSSMHLLHTILLVMSRYMAFPNSAVHIDPLMDHKCVAKLY